MSQHPENLLEFAVSVAKAAGDHTLKYFKKSVEIISKNDDSPVTIADREAELVMRKMISERFPEHGIIGEEHGIHQPDAYVQWILDPIDGTVGFIHGIPLYTNLIGITIGGVPVVGVINAPYMNEMVCAAKDSGAYFNHTKTTVRKIDSLKNASLMTSDVQYFNQFGYKASFERLLTQVKTHRTYGDAYGHLMVATGRADIMLDPILAIWDAAALLPVISEAGGSFTDLKGNPRIDGGNGFACHADFKEELIHLFDTYK